MRRDNAIDNFTTDSAFSPRRADFMVQVAVHPECSNIVSAAHFDHGIHVVDTFISPTKELGIVTRKDLTSPARSTPTRSYADLSRDDDSCPIDYGHD